MWMLVGGLICDKGLDGYRCHCVHCGTDRLRLKNPQGREKDLHEKLTLVCVCECVFVCVSASLRVYVKVNVEARMRWLLITADRFI